MKKTVYDGHGNVNKWEGTHWTVKRHNNTLVSGLKAVFVEVVMLAGGLATAYYIIINLL